MAFSAASTAAVAAASASTASCSTLTQETDWRISRRLALATRRLDAPRYRACECEAASGVNARACDGGVNARACDGGVNATRHVARARWVRGAGNGARETARVSMDEY